MHSSHLPGAASVAGCELKSKLESKLESGIRTEIAERR